MRIRPNTRVQADVIISLDLGGLDVAQGQMSESERGRGSENKFTVGQRHFLHLKYKTTSECQLEKISGPGGGLESQGASAHAWPT
jgi:hypothetical protein